MNEIRKLALTYLQDYCAGYGVYIRATNGTSIYKVVDRKDCIANAIIRAIGLNDYRWLKQYLALEEDYTDTKDDLYQLAVKIANLV